MLLIIFHGKRHVDSHTDEHLDIFMDGGRVAVRVDSGYSGNVIVKFSNFVSWKIASVVSIITAVMLLIEFLKVYCNIGAEWRLVWTKKRG